MIFLGLGLGSTSAPATEAIMGVVPANKAGQGSAVNDATREIGGTLGVAVIGSVFASVYANALREDDKWAALPESARRIAEDGVGLAFRVADQSSGQIGASGAKQLVDGAISSFLDGLAAGCLVAAAVTLAGSLMAAVLLPSRPGQPL